MIRSWYGKKWRFKRRSICSFKQKERMQIILSNEYAWWRRVHFMSIYGDWLIDWRPRTHPRSCFPLVLSWNAYQWWTNEGARPLLALVRTFSSARLFWERIFQQVCVSHIGHYGSFNFVIQNHWTSFFFNMNKSLEKQFCSLKGILYSYRKQSNSHLLPKLSLRTLTK